ncbi:YtxH domain-containing protein [Neobacillus notoginsengisoli]|uniref:YtxH domain-containing protein n=1 Tax=Neobacillus notoginsengisoli TaxID=1578198 RepID=A0A417YYZ3_9BACI|nr:YtxH domain-containing protein [Neobacillus notoginsengisoli]RHW43130.1 YtxH domain-containing protein [Neobacillus notoginsengisoli]
MGAKRFLYGFLLGSAAAGLATLFTVPQSGRETRETLKNSKDTFISQLKDLKQSIMDVKDASAYATKEGRVHVSRFIQEVNTAIGRWKAETLPQQIEIQKEISEIEAAIGHLENELSAHSATSNAHGVDHNNARQ